MKYTLALLLLSPLAMSLPNGFVSIDKLDPSIQVEARYFGEDNFVGQRIDGYQAPKCVLSLQAAKALEKAQALAKEWGLALKVFDCYRPQSAVNHFVRWAKDLGDTKMKKRYYPNVPKSELFSQGYIAEKSGHSRGSTVDLTLTQNGNELEMGTIFDFFDPRSHTEAPETIKEAAQNRANLKRIMHEAGFKNYPQEWWHYTLIDEPHKDTYFQFPVE